MKPMLAGKTEGRDLVFPLLASPKLDGVRALVIDGVVVSRKLIAIPNRHVQKCFGRSAYNGMDGELLVGPGNEPTTYRDTMSGVMSVDGAPQVTFNVFDDFSVTKGFHERLFRLKVRVRQAGNPNLLTVDHDEIGEEDTLDKYEAAALADGYEGVMIRSLNGPYKQGRSTTREGWLLKLKRFEDAEAVVVGVEELQHNTNEATRSNVGTAKRSSHKAGKVAGGVLGALVVRQGKGLEFGIGSGFTAAEREQLWAIRDTLKGKIVKFRYFPSGNKDRPRFPTYLGFRSRIDL